METEGYVLPETRAEAREVFDELAPVAREVVRAVMRDLAHDVEDVSASITDSTIETGHEAIFGSLLVVTVGTMAEFEAWQERPAYEEYDVRIEGSEHVDNAVWHAAPMEEAVIVATFQEEREAAMATLRRIAWGRLYRPVLSSD